MIKKEISRRKFIQQLSLSSLALYLPWQTYGQLNASKPPYVDPVTALAVTKTALDLINNFSGPKKSAMASMLQYQNQMLDIISNQLTDIQKSLVEVENAIATLPEKFEKALKLQFQSELIAEVRGAANRYNYNYLRPSMEDPELIKNEDVRNEIRDIINIADQKLSTLKGLSGGLSPEACMIAPLALSLEVAGRSALGMPTASIKATLLKYKEWFSDMVSDKAGAIPDIQNKTMLYHDQIISKLEKNHLAKMYQLQNYKIRGTQTSAYCNDPVILFTRIEIRGSSIDKNRLATTKVNNLKGWTHGIYSRSAKLQSVLREDLGTHMIEFSDPLIMIAENKQQVNFTFPKNGEYCYLYWDAPKSADRKQLENIANSNGNRWSDHKVNREKIKQAIFEANLQRVKLCFCSYGYTIANNTTQRINEYLKLL
ncbi:hypothetical protein [Zhouia amylolytica]|uniref:Uncharacterized protein n=1 Tax=Zhouia amylolytica AD3 TaxID=1286632 RepID=W2URN8_9FLAO|nr:hypothetical protein [Zhouia amylolytica]ETN96146.1 hypothetical protein P278_09470 [Zhouia amylolytica AD3]